MEPRPKFRSDLILVEHVDGGRGGHATIKDPVSQKFFRLSADELRFLRLLNGKLTVDQARERLKLSGAYLSSEEARSLATSAAEMGLLLGTPMSSGRFMQRKKELAEQAQRQRLFSSVYFLFIPLWNPDRFLEATLPAFKAVCNRWVAGFAAFLTPIALYLVITGFPSLDEQFSFFFNWENLLILWITIALTKLFHELAHAYTAKSFGLHVPQMGVAFLIFFPCLYCNTTDAWQLANRRERMAISAAGIIAEAALAVLATYVWFFTRPGVVNSLAFYLMAVSFVSTVLFNGNPLMRFDGYFILIDALNLPNLAQKSFGYLKHLFLGAALGVATVPNPASSSRQAAIFGTYGVAALIYRFFLYTGIVAGVYYRFDKFIGLTLALLAFSLFIVKPVIRTAKSLYAKRREMNPSGLRLAFLGFGIGAVLLVLSAPISTRSIYLCYLDSACIQKLTAPLQTSVARVLIREGDEATGGTLLFQLDATKLKLGLANKEIEREIIKKEMELLLLDEKKMADVSGKIIELAQKEHEIRLLKKELSTAQDGIRAPFDGVVAKLDHRMQPGFQPGEGSVVGELRCRKDCVVRTLIPEPDIHRISRGQAVEVWFPIGAGRTFLTRIDSIKMHSERTLPDSPFSSRLGGEIATEQPGGDTADKPIEAQYICSSHFSNDESLPLGLTGKCAIASPPRSILSRLLNLAIRTFNRESLL